MRRRRNIGVRVRKGMRVDARTRKVALTAQAAAEVVARGTIRSGFSLNRHRVVHAVRVRARAQRWSRVDQRRGKRASNAIAHLAGEPGRCRRAGALPHVPVITLGDKHGLGPAGQRDHVRRGVGVSVRRMGVSAVARVRVVAECPAHR